MADPRPLTLRPGTDTQDRRDDNAITRLIVEAIERLDYGYVTVVVHDGRVVQIETTQKQRL